MIPTFLSEFVRDIIIMSITGGALVLFLWLIKPLVRHRLPKSAQYIFWLVALFALLIPISRIVVLPGTAPNIAPIHAVVERNVISVNEEAVRVQEHESVTPQERVQVNNVAPADAPRQIALDLTPPPELSASGFAMLSTAFMLIYPLVAVFILLYNLIGYACFVKKLRRGRLEPHPHELDMLDRLTENTHKPRLIISEHAGTPMLIGLFRPTIVLPERNYVNEQLKSILLHELTHMRRKDIVAKWLSLIALSLHWFNPLVWFLRREIDSICELSCDEAVIRDMDSRAKQAYGETLIAAASRDKMPLPVLSTTMCAQKYAIKERLGAIMKSKRHTKPALVVSAIILLTAVLGACTLGARSGQNPTDDANVPTEIINNEPPSVEFLAMQYMEEMINSLYVFLEDESISRPANILHARVLLLERLHTFYALTPEPIEMWRLVFEIQTDDIEDGNIRWGTFAPDEQGWLGKHMGWHESDVVMIFAQNAVGFDYLGNLGRWEAYDVIYGNGAEHFLREFLSNINFLGLETIPNVGAAHETHRIVSSLPLPDGSWQLNSIQIGANHGGFSQDIGAYSLTVFYDAISGPAFWSFEENMPNDALKANAARLFRQIENLQAVTFSVNDLAASFVPEYHYRWSITRAASDAGAAGITSFLGMTRPESLLQATDEITLRIRSIEGLTHEYDMNWDTNAGWDVTPIAIEPNVTLQNFRWVEVLFTYDSGTWLRQQNIIFHLDELAPNTPFAVVLPNTTEQIHRAISFVDEFGMTRYFGVVIDAENGAPFALYDFLESTDSILMSTTPERGSIRAVQSTPTAVLTLLDSIYMGMTRAQAESLLATNGHRLIRHLGEGHIYRYDLIYDYGYEFIAPTGTDTLDYDGLQEGRVRLVLFLHLSPNDINESLAIYYSIWDGSIYEVHMHPDIAPPHIIVNRLMHGGAWNHDDSVLWN